MKKRHTPEQPRKRAERKNHVWSYDFVMDLTDDGRRLTMMPIS
jgi:hypothetical protein